MDKRRHMPLDDPNEGEIAQRLMTGRVKKRERGRLSLI
jgi:hypothetical protein